MQNRFNSYADIIHILTLPIGLSRTMNHICGMGLFAILMALGAFVRIYLPFTPVPITLQTMFALLAGAFLGASWGAGAMGLYLLIGMCGIPVFADAYAGLFYLLGPTGGYLIGFPVAAWIVGTIAGSRPHPPWSRVLGSLLAGLAAIYVLGITQLMLWGRCNLGKALFMGLFPFVPGEILKILVAAPIIKHLTSPKNAD